MKSLEENIMNICISRIPELSPIFLKELINKYNCLENLYKVTEVQMINDYIKEIEDNIKLEKIIREITNPKYKNNLNKYIEAMKKQNIKLITIEDKEYPQNLKQIYDAPINLYCKGNEKLLNANKKIAIIGCRDYTEYGKKVALEMSRKLAQENIIIISGGARGIDTFAHMGTLKEKGKTIEVLGNGLDYIYPPENRKLEEEIIKSGGLLISEYVIGKKPDKYTFPARNRIISGISDGVLVVEAKQRSGTLITVDFALEQGKTIFAVPGNIESKNSVGTNELIKQGAKLVNNIKDILEEI